MADSIQFDFTEINALAADLGDAPRDAGVKIRQAVEFTARGVKDAWRDKLKGTQGLPVAFLTIDYDLDHIVGEDASSITATIGSRTGKKQATFVTVMEFGAPGQNLAPRGYGAGALQENQADFEKGLSIAIGEPLR